MVSVPVPTLSAFSIDDKLIANGVDATTACIYCRRSVSRDFEELVQLPHICRGMGVC